MLNWQLLLSGIAFPFKVYTILYSKMQLLNVHNFYFFVKFKKFIDNYPAEIFFHKFFLHLPVKLKMF